MAERIRKSAEKRIIKAYDTTLNVTLSIGIAIFPSDGKLLEELMDKADWALYRAKSQGRNCVVAFGHLSKIMKTPSKIFILVLLLLAFLASLAWVGVRHLGGILHEFDRVAQVDLVMMEGTTNLNDLQLEKEIIFAKLTSSAEELAFGQVNAARGQYLADYIKGLSEQFDSLIEKADQQMRQIDELSAVPVSLKDSFEQMRHQTQEYDLTVRDIFKAVQKGGYQLSLEDLEETDARQKILTEHVQTIVSQVWGLVHESLNKSRHWRQQSKAIFWFSLLLTATLGLLLFAFKENLDEISKQKKDLEKLNQELDRFVHTVSHDIAGPSDNDCRICGLFGKSIFPAA